MAVKATEFSKFKRGDEIETIVDALVRDPSRADDAKAALRQRLHGEKLAVNMPSGPKHQSARAGDDGDDDPWDNVPV